MFVLSLALVVTNLYLAHRTQSYVSDDVSWQTILMTWTPFNHHTAYMGIKDNFVTNAPLIWLMGRFFSPSRTLIFAEATILATINFTLFYIAGLYFLKKCNIVINYLSLLPFLWLASFSRSFAALFLNTAWRDFEPGVIFILFVLVAKYYFDEINPLHSRLSMVIAALVSLVTGVFIFSDPYFLYFGVVPTVGLFIVLAACRKLPRKKLWVVLAMTVMSLVFAEATRVALARIGLLVPAKIILLLPAKSLKALVTNLSVTYKGLLSIFGANLLHKHMLALALVTAFVNLVILALIVYRFGGLLVRRGNSGQSAASEKARFSPKQRKSLNPIFLWGVFFGVVGLLVFVGNVLSSVATNGVYRYLILAVYALVMLLALAVGALDKKFHLLVAAALVLAVVLNTSSFYRNITVKAAPNVSNRELISRVEKLGLTKGYVNYWDGNINTFLSKDAVDFLPVTCGKGQTIPYYTLVDGSQFTKLASRTFYLIDPKYKSPAMCTGKQLIAQFGQPSQIVHLSGKKTLLIYNHDLITDMQHS